jgi:hypothetical protein
MSAGVATGVVVYHREGDAPEVTGDAVREASTLCVTAGPNHIAVAERTVRAARDEFEFGPMTAGSGPTPVAQATLRVPGPTRPQRRLGHRFVGRGDELDTLASAYHRSVEFSRPHLVTVVGEAGMGKSTLVARFVDHLRSVAHPTPSVYSGRCLSQGVAATYGAAAEVLSVILGLDQDASTAEIQRAIAGNEILGLTFGLDAAGDLDPRTARHKLQEAWIRLIEPLTPAAIVVEDVHWASAPLLDLVNRLVAEVAGALLVVCTARPEYADGSDLGLRPRHQVLWLERLSESHAATLLKELLHDDPPDTIRQGVLGQAEGNPFFIEELTATLVDRRVLVRSDKGWQVDADAMDAPLPDSVHSALAARINYLHSSSRATLLSASVAGRTFTTSEVARLVDGEPAIAELVERDFIRPLRRTATATTTYTFKHALTRQVAYDLLPVWRRARLHATLADHLADGADVDDRAMALAHHYGEAARPDTADLAWHDEPAELERITEHAITWLWEAGKLSIQRFAVDDALGLLQRAEVLVTEPVTRARIWRTIAEAHAEVPDDRRYLDALQYSIDVCADPQEQAEAYVLMGNMVTAWGIVSTVMPSPQTVLAWYDRALALGRPGTNAHTWAMILRAAFDHTLLAALATDAFAEAQHTDDFDHMHDAQTLQIMLALRERRYDDMLDWTMRRHAGQLARTKGDPYELKDCHLHVAMPLMHLGRFDEAREYLARNEEVASHLGPAMKAYAVAWWIELEALANEWSRVRDLEPALQSFTDDDLVRRRVLVIRAVVLSAVAHVHVGDLARSEALVRQAEQMAGGHDDRIAATHVQLALARGDVGAVRDLMPRLPKQLPPWGTWWMLHLETTRLEAVAALGDSAAAEEEARPHLDTGVFLDAVARRTLGIVRHDPALLHSAANAFTGMNLPVLALRARTAASRIAGDRANS